MSMTPVAAPAGPVLAPEVPPAPSPRPLWPWVLLVAAVACAVYAQTVGYGFTYDDVVVIQDRALFHSLANWRAILTASWWPDRNLYRPLTQLTFALNWTAGGGAPTAFHVTNIALHAVATGMVYLLALQLLGARCALVAGLLFAVHPVHVEAVANVVGRAEVLAAIFTLGAVLAYMADGRLADAGDDRSWRRYLTSFGTLGATALALASKESAFALPALLLLVDWFDAGRKNRRSIGVDRHWVLWLGVVGVALGWLLWRSRLVGDLTGLEVAAGLEGRGLSGRTQVMLPIVLHYVRLLVAPLRLSADYSPNFIVLTSSLTWAGLCGLAVVLGGVAIGWAARRRAPGVTFAVGWTAATVLIVANILAPTGVLLAERTLYLASVGAVLALAWAVVWCLDRWRNATAVGLAALVVAGVVRTVTRNPVWRDNDALYPQIIRDAPGSFMAKTVAAKLAANRGDMPEAARLLRESLAIHPLAWAVWKNLGNVLVKQRRFSEASDAWWAAWRLNPNAVLTAQGAIQTALMASLVDTAAARIAVARAARPQSGELILAEADVAMSRGQAPKAMVLRRQVARVYPDSARFWKLTADAALQAGDCPELTRSISRLRALRADSVRVDSLAMGARRLACR